MQITCTICSDILIPQDEVYGTKCGHIFHYTCLLQWLERSATCPQCRTKTTDKTIFRVYFNIPSGPIQDPSELQNKIDSLNFKVLLKDQDLKNYITEVDKLKTQISELRDHAKNLESKMKTSDISIASLKEQVQILKKRNKDTEKLQIDCTTLRNRLEFFQNIETIVKGTAEDADSILSNCNGSMEARSHATYASILKGELQAATEKKKDLIRKVREAENRESALSSEVKKLRIELQKSVETAARLEDDLKHLEQERSSLMVKLKSMEEAILSPSGSHPSTSALKRLIQESPAPERLVKKPVLSSPESETSILENEDSPYLKIKSSSVGLTPLRPTQTNVLSSSNKFSIFKKPRLNNLPTSSKVGSEEFYDGLGGHSKLDEFPKSSSFKTWKLSKPAPKPVMKMKLKDATSLKMDLFLRK